MLCHADQQQAEAILVSMAGRTRPILLDIPDPADAVTQGCILLLSEGLLVQALQTFEPSFRGADSVTGRTN